MLSEIKAYLMRHGWVSLNDLAIHFDMDGQALASMVELWVKKGRVRKTQVSYECSKGCSNCCCASTMVIYAWIPRTG